jgi:hypothetical protein
MHVLNIRIQHTRPESFKDGDVTRHLRDILDRDIPVVLTLSAVYDGNHRDEKYPQELLDLAHEIGSKEHSAIGQQGALGARCKYKHRITDPWHENDCLYHKAPGYTEQSDGIENGKEIVEKLVGIFPVFFAPSNHLYNGTTLTAAIDAGFTHFGDRAMIDMPAYRNRVLTVLPEANLERGPMVNAPMVYVHYDRIDGNPILFQNALVEACPLSDVNPNVHPPQSLIKQNHRKKVRAKLARDIINLPKRFLNK